MPRPGADDTQNPTYSFNEFSKAKHAICRSICRHLEMLSW